MITSAAALLVLSKLGITAQDLLGGPTERKTMPTFRAYIPIVSAAVSDGARRVYGSYWNRILAEWPDRRLDEPNPTEVKAFVEKVKVSVAPRRNDCGGRAAAEHLVAAFRCVYKHAENDKLIKRADNPALQVDKPRRLPSTRRAIGEDRLAEINHVAATTGNDLELDTLIIRLHTETACHRAGALALRPQDLWPAWPGRRRRRRTPARSAATCAGRSATAVGCNARSPCPPWPR